MKHENILDELLFLLENEGADPYPEFTEAKKEGWLAVDDLKKIFSKVKYPQSSLFDVYELTRYGVQSLRKTNDEIPKESYLKSEKVLLTLGLLVPSKHPKFADRFPTFFSKEKWEFSLTPHCMDRLYGRKKDEEPLRHLQGSFETFKNDKQYQGRICSQLAFTFKNRQDKDLYNWSENVGVFAVISKSTRSKYIVMVIRPNMEDKISVYKVYFHTALAPKMQFTQYNKEHIFVEETNQ